MFQYRYDIWYYCTNFSENDSLSKENPHRSVSLLILSAIVFTHLLFDILSLAKGNDIGDVSNNMDDILPKTFYSHIVAIRNTDIAYCHIPIDIIYSHQNNYNKSPEIRCAVAEQVCLFWE